MVKQTLIILRGAPASGKSTIARKLRNYEEKIVWLKVDNFKPFFSEDADETVDDVNKTALITLNYLLGRGFSVVMEGIFQNPGYVKDAIRIASLKNIPSFAFQLTCSIETLKNRDLKREGIKEGCRKPLGNETIERLYSIINNNPSDKFEFLDTENQPIDECIKIIKKVVDY